MENDNAVTSTKTTDTEKFQTISDVVEKLTEKVLTKVDPNDPKLYDAHNRKDGKVL